MWDRHVDGRIFFRDLPCYCQSCQQGWIEPCVNGQYTGDWNTYIQKLVGQRIIKKYKKKQDVEEEQ